MRVINNEEPIYKQKWFVAIAAAILTFLATTFGQPLVTNWLRESDPITITRPEPIEVEKNDIDDIAFMVINRQGHSVLIKDIKMEPSLDWKKNLDETLIESFESWAENRSVSENETGEEEGLEKEKIEKMTLNASGEHGHRKFYDTESYYTPAEAGMYTVEVVIETSEGTVTQEFDIRVRDERGYLELLSKKGEI